MRILGIDFGSKRVGIALSDSSASIGQPYKVLQNTKTLLQDVVSIITKEEVKEIVVGESKNFKGQDNVIMDAVRTFKKELEDATKLPVHYEPEFMSSEQAQHFQGKNEFHDASAAAIILQSYLDRIKNI